MDDPAYVGIKDGTIRAFTRDAEDYRDDIANSVAIWIRLGYAVERMNATEALARMTREHTVSG